MESTIAELRTRMEAIEGRMATRDREHVALHSEVKTAMDRVNGTANAQGKDLAEIKQLLITARSRIEELDQQGKKLTTISRSWSQTVSAGRRARMPWRRSKGRGWIGW